MGFSYVFHSAVCLAVASASIAMSEVAVRGNSHIPSSHSLDHCRKSCGDVNISYPFGVGPGCFRDGFELICQDSNDPASTTGMLFFRNNTNMQVTDIDMRDNVIQTTPMIFNITERPGLDTYYMSWEAPAKGITVDDKINNLYIVGCGVKVYLLTHDTDDLIGSCMTMCVEDKGTMEKVNADGICHGFGCCRISMPYVMRAFRLKMVLRDSTMPQPNEALSGFNIIFAASYVFDTRDLYSKSVNASNIIAGLILDFIVTDQPSCEAAKTKMDYACNDESFCENLSSTDGYYCSCNGLDIGNPYIKDGCIVYNPKANGKRCTRSCGNVTIPFPFGIENGCSANKDFQLICTSNNIPILDRWYAQFRVTNVSLDDGTLRVTNMLNQTSSNSNVLIVDTSTEDSDIHGTPIDVNDDVLNFSQEDEIKVKWAVANISCQRAKQQSATYACLSDHTDCLYAMHGKRRLGYRCKCSKGFEGNPYIQNGCTDIDECSIPNFCQGTCQNYEGGFKCTSCPHGKSYDRTKQKCLRSAKQHILFLGITIGVAGALGLLILTLGAVLLANKWKKVVQRTIERENYKRNQRLLLQHLTSEEIATNMPKLFSLKELEEASNNFDATRILGSGGHGTVYKGILSDQHVVAIKKSKRVNQAEIDEFINEIAILSRLIHRNVVRLFGYCLETEVPLLVYEFMSNGTLSDLLHKDITAKCFLSWRDRIRIAAEVAGALAHLHSTANIKIFHRDVKSANILIDDRFTAKVSDFGLSRSLLFEASHVRTDVKGTPGYLDPEYLQNLQLTNKSDVYSMGVILVELLTRKKSHFAQSSGTTQQYLSRYFVRHLEDGTLMEIIDPQVVEEAHQEDIQSIALLAEACLKKQGRYRPTMNEVEMRLQFIRTERLIRRNNSVPIQTTTTNRVCNSNP